MRLKVSSNLGPLIDLEYQNGGIIVHLAKDELQAAVDRWLQYGLHEWVPEVPETSRYTDYYPRSTEVSSPEFLPRLKEYLERQFHFTYELIP